MDENEKARYHTKRVLEEIKAKRGRGTELISVYIPPTKHIYDVQSYLRNELSESSNIKSKSTMKNVTGALESIMSRLKAFKTPPPNGLIMFTGHVPKGGDQTSMVSFMVEPPEPVTTFIYRCDSTFFIEPIMGMLEEKEVYGLIVIDRSEGTVGFLRGMTVVPVKNVQSLVPSKHNKGGQSSKRFERLIEIAAHEFFTKIGNISNETFLPHAELKGVLIGGPGATKDFFVTNEYLHHELRKKIIGTFDTGYTDEYGLRELVDSAKEKLDELGLMDEKKLVQQFLRELRNSDGGLAVYGEKQTLEALGNGAVGTLLVADSMRKWKVKMTCPSCGGYEEKTVMEKLESPRCPKDQTLYAVEEEDFIESLYGLAENFKTEVRLISGDSEEGELLFKAFGGLAGLLRYRT